MTMLASWVGIDTHGIGSAYIVSDSRFTWNNNTFFDYGKKVFASNTYPEIFGYAGDVLFPSIVLSQIVEMIDSGLLFTPNTSCEEKNKLIYDILQKELAQYPRNQMCDSFEILHISRDTIVSGYPDFYCYYISWSKSGGWRKENRVMPISSGILFVLGSGRSEFDTNYSRYKNGNNSDTSRNVFHCFVDTLSNIKDKYCGGAPQLVGVYRKPKSFGKNFGIIFKEKRYFLGAEILDYINFDAIEWRNELFELCNGKDKHILTNAQRQPDTLRRY